MITMYVDSRAQWLVRVMAIVLGVAAFLLLSSAQVLAAPTGGDWVSTYGHEGYDLAGWYNEGSTDLVDIPGVSVTLEQGNRYVWEASTTEERALEGPEGAATREAATYYDPTELKLKLSFKEAYTGELHLYAIDWDSEERREIIRVGSHTAMLSENFHSGAWVSLPIEVSAGGSVTIGIECTGGKNAVLSGMFLGGSGAPTSVPVETTPQGNWVGAYGHEGYDLGAWSDSGDLADIPGASLTLTQGSRYEWAASTTEERALEGPEGAAKREAAAYYENSHDLILHLSFKNAYKGQLHLYAVDWDSETRREAIIVQGQTALLSSSFHKGAWVSFPIEVSAGGSVTITVHRTAGDNAVISGVFLGGSGSPPSRILVPEYWYQNESDWHSMCNEMPQGSTVIINPANGPGTKADVEAYNSDIAYCQEMGQRVIGYVPTDWGLEEEVPPATKEFYTKSYIEKDVSLYYEATSDKINGIFYDQFGEEPAHKTLAETEVFYKALAPVPDDGFTLGNPGDEAAESDWQFGVVDALNVFEGSGFSTSFTPKSWVSEAGASRTAAIIYDATEAQMEADCEKATEDKLGYVYITNEEDAVGDGYNPYRELPSYWISETAHC